MIQGSLMRWAVLALLIGAGCMPLNPRRAVTPLRAPRATLADITAPAQRPDEVDRLPGTAAGQLRRAWLLTRRGSAKQALHAANRLIYDRSRQPASVRSLAYYVRAQAFRREGDKDRAIEDLRRARSLAVRKRLKARCGAELAILAPPKPKPRPAVAHKPAVRKTKVDIVPRSSWNASRPVVSRMKRMRGVRKLTIHHSANLSRSTRRQVVATQIRGIQQYHVSQNRWGDIGYHFLIDPAGRVWEGRGIAYQGAHAGGDHNRNNVGICLLGKFTGGGQNPSEAQVRAMANLVGWLRDKYNIPALGVLTHKEITVTECPGTRLQRAVNRMRKLLVAQPRPNGSSDSLAGR